MRLTKLRVDTLAGLERPVEVGSFGPGVNVVLGPNASGKSSLVRALLAILYPGEEQGTGPVDARAELVGPGGVVYRARRLGDSVAWESSGAPVEPPPLPARHLVGTYVLSLEDLLGPGEGRAGGKRRPEARSERPLDALIARSLDKELTGGIDLKAVRKAIGTQAEKGQRLAGLLRDAAAALAESRRHSAALRQQELSLSSSRDELSGTQAIAARQRTVRDALELLEADLELSSLRASLAALPAQLGSLLGNEAEELSSALAAKERSERELGQLDELASQAREHLEGLGVPAALTVSSAQLHLDLAEAFVTSSGRLQQKELEIGGLRARHAEALRRIGGSLQPGTRPLPAAAPVPEALFDVSTLEQIERLLEKRQAARAEVHEVRRQLEEVSRLVEPAENDDALLDVSAGVYRGGRTMDGLAAPLRGVRHDLMRWLREPAHEARRPDWAWAVALGLAVAAVGGAGFGVSARWLAVLAGLEVVWLGAVWLVLPPVRSPVKARIEADVKAMQDATDLTLPAEWTYGSVVELVLDVDDEIARREASEREYERYDLRLRQLTGHSQQAQKRAERLQAEIESLRGRVGYGVTPDLGLAMWLQAAREVDATRRSIHAAQAELASLGEAFAVQAERLESYLSDVSVAGSDVDEHAGDTGSSAPEVAGSSERGGAAVKGQALDPYAVRARCRELLRLGQERRGQLGELERLQRERRRVGDEARRQQAQADAIIERCGLDGLGPNEALLAVGRLVAELPRWREAREQLQAKEAVAGELRVRVAHDDELLAAAENHDRAALEAAAARAEQAAVRAQELIRDIHRTERDVERAGSERRLQQAAAAVRAASDDLMAHRHVATELAAAEFMLDTVEAEHQAGARPAALERASDWFARFTSGAFELTFEPADGGGRALGARDTSSGRRLELAELSTGTRAQLLLASRLAFALESERAGVPLPFFLDEALTTSDERRFRQVAGAILTVARDDGRQFIYLSARDDDADLWRKAAAEHGVGIELIESLESVA